MGSFDGLWLSNALIRDQNLDRIYWVTHASALEECELLNAI